MADDNTTANAVVNPKRILVQREREAGLEEDPHKKAAGIDKGDIPGPHVDFFKPRDRSGDAAGLAKALKNRK